MVQAGATRPQRTRLAVRAGPTGPTGPLANNTKITLPEDRIPKNWYNIIADLPVPPPPPLNPAVSRSRLHGVPGPAPARPCPRRRADACTAATACLVPADTKSPFMHRMLRACHSPLQTLQPLAPEDLAAIFPMDLIVQEVRQICPIYELFVGWNNMHAGLPVEASESRPVAVAVW